MNLIQEAIVIGLITGIVGLVISTALMYYTAKDFSLSKYHFWKSVFIAHFLTGAAIHIGFEKAGWNNKYCEYKLKV